MGGWMLHSKESKLLWELDLRRKRGHVARGSGGLSAGVGVSMVHGARKRLRGKSIVVAAKDLRGLRQSFGGRSGPRLKKGGPGAPCP
jgi:hypothetical protein